MSRQSGAHCFVERSSQYCGWVAGEAVAETLKAVSEELAQMCLSDSAEWRHSGTRTAELLGFSLEILKSRPKVYQKFNRFGKDTLRHQQPVKSRIWSFLHVALQSPSEEDTAIPQLPSFTADSEAPMISLARACTLHSAMHTLFQCSVSWDKIFVNLKPLS